MRNKKVYLTTSFKFCKTNAYLGSQLYSFFEMNGFWIVNNPEEADFIIITTCAFDNERESGALSIVDDLSGKFAFKKKIIVCGCLPKINKDIPNDKRIIAIGPKELTKFDEIFAARVKIEDIYAGKLNKYFCADRIGELEYGYIQIGHGCVNKCSYCIIKKAKGNIESKSPEQILHEFKLGIKSGLRKFFLLADDCGSYGLDIKTDFAELLNLLCSELGDSFDSLGILYFEPNQLIKLYPRIDKNVFKKIDSINVPVQTVSPRLLKLMNRDYSINAVLNILAEIKSINKKIDFRTHLIYGFPGESRKDFASLVSLVGHFNLISCFYYSDRKGTKAYNLGGKASRSEIMYRTSVIMRMENQAGDQAKLKTKIELAYQPKTVFASIAKTVPPGAVDVLLVCLGSKNENDASVYPLPLLELAEPLVRNNIKVEALDGRHEPYLSRKVIDLARKNKLICIGFVCAEQGQIEEIKRLSRLIKSKLNIPVVVEGCPPGIEPGQLINNNVEFIINEGSGISLFQLVNALRKGGPVFKVKGLLFKKARRIIHNRAKDSGYAQSFHPLPYYLLSEYFSKYRIARIQTGQEHRGAFTKQRTENDSPETIINKVEDLFFYVDNTYVDFIEHDFLADATRAREFISKLLVEIKNGRISSFPWSFRAGIESLANLSTGLLKLLKQSGLDSIRVDVESYLDNKDEGGSREFKAGKVIKACGLLKAFNINVRDPGDLKGL